MARTKNQLRIVARRHTPLTQNNSEQPPTVSPRWLLSAMGITLACAALCGWATLCLLFWQGSWQLLFHPKSSLSRSPSSTGIAFEPIGFAATDTGQLRLQGWWIPADQSAPLSRFTILYLHGATGNLGDAVDALAHLHAVGVNVFAFDYRGYGLSQFLRPSERHWTEDANLALDYLAQTRHTQLHSIILAGNELGADLAVEVAAAHPDLAGVIVDSPVEDPASVIFSDSRAHLVPAHLLVRDRFDVDAAAARLSVPSLWLLPSAAAPNAGLPSAFSKITVPHQLVRIGLGQETGSNIVESISQWLSNLPVR